MTKQYNSVTEMIDDEMDWAFRIRWRLTLLKKWLHKKLGFPGLYHNKRPPHGFVDYEHPPCGLEEDQASRQQ